MFPAIPWLALVRRELLREFRRPRAFFMLLATALVAVCLLVLVWPDQRLLSTQGGAASLTLLGALQAAMFLSAMLFIPGLAGNAFASEHASDTFDQLHLTLISPKGMLLGKLINVLAFYTLLLFGVLPIFGCIFFLLGVDWFQAIFRVGMLYLAALLAASSGLCAGVCFRRPIRAIVGAYVLLFSVTLMVCVAFFVVAVAANFLFFDTTAPFRSIGGYLRNILSFYGLHDLVYRWYRPERFMEDVFLVLTPTGCVIDSFQDCMTFAHYLLTILYQSLLSAAFLVFARRRLSKPPVPALVVQRKPLDSVAELEKRRKKFPYYLVDPLKRPDPIADGRNPVLVREMRWGLLGKMTFLVRIFYGAFFFFLLTGMVCFFVLFGTNVSDGLVPMCVLMAVCISLAIPAVTASLFTGERDSGNADMLHMTLLTPDQIAAGKLAGGILTIAPMLAGQIAAMILILLLMLAAFFELDSLAVVFQGCVTSGVSAFLIFGLSMMVAANARQTTSALTFSYVLTLIAQAGLFAAAYVLWCYVNESNKILAFGSGYLRNPIDSTSFSAYLVFACSPIASFLKPYVSVEWYRSGGHGWIPWSMAMLLHTAIGVAAMCLSITIAIRGNRRRN